MEKNKIKIIINEEQSVSYTGQFNDIDDTTSPFKEILHSRDVFNLKLSINGEEEYSLENSLLLKISVKPVGVFNILLKNENINKKEIIDKVEALKELPVTNNDEAKEKVSNVVDLFDKEELLFVIYKPCGEFSLKKEEIPFDCFVFFTPKKEEMVVVEEKKEKNDFFEKFLGFFAPLKNNGIHYAFALIATFLIGFTISIGLYNYYAANKLYILFFVCTFIGLVLLTFVHIDFFKNHYLKSSDYALTLIIEYLTGALSVGIFVIFYSLQTNISESLTSPRLIILLTALLVVVSPIITGLVGYLLKGKKNDD